MPLHCGQLNRGVAFVLFNDAVLSGVDTALRLLQRAIGAAEDGVMGPETLDPANAMSSVELIKKLAKADEVYLRFAAEMLRCSSRGWDAGS